MSEKEKLYDPEKSVDAILENKRQLEKGEGKYYDNWLDRLERTVKELKKEE